jgi:hypothetical protein
LLPSAERSHTSRIIFLRNIAPMTACKKLKTTAHAEAYRLLASNDAAGLAD